jgi:glutathione S-transferase
LEELGLEFELLLARPRVETHTRTFEALNPNRKVPVLVDGDVVVWESMAINFYLAERYGEWLWPHDPGHRAEVLQWSFWVANDVEPYLWRMWQEADTEAEAPLRRALSMLDAVLEGREWIVGESFTLADLHLESYIVRARRGGYRLRDHRWLYGWIERCEARPARRRVRDRIRAYEDGENE